MPEQLLPRHFFVASRVRAQNGARERHGGAMRILKLAIGIGAILAAFILAAQDNTSQVGGGMLASAQPTLLPSVTPVVSPVPTATPPPLGAHRRR